VEYGILSENRDHGDCKTIFYIDGGDVSDIRIKPCFKREMFEENGSVFPTGFGIPKSEILPINLDAKDRLIPKTTPDIELMHEFGTKPKVHFHPTLSRYAIENEKDYIEDIAKSWFFPVTQRGGWDSLRPYQGVAYGTLVLFRDYHQKPPLCSPQNFPCLTYSSVQELKDVMNWLLVDNEPSSEYYDMLSAQRVWLIENGTCEARALSLMEKIIELV